MSKTSTPSRKAPLLFLKKFLKHGKQVASVAPSSKSLARAVSRHIDPTRPQTVVELGAGTGAVTIVAAQRLHPDSRLIALELDEDFANHLKTQCPRAEVVAADVMDTAKVLADLGIEKVDLFLSGLPMPSMPLEVNRAVVDAFTKFADEESYFSQLTVMPYLFMPFYQKLFHEVRYSMVVANIPPGGVYHCRRVREDYADRLKRR